jgi:hypothetical protein
MSVVPATRSLAAVLRQAFDAAPTVRLLVAAFGAADPSNAYCNVVIQGQTIRVPMLSGVADTPGKAAYLLATKDLILCIGSVST